MAAAGQAVPVSSEEPPDAGGRHAEAEWWLPVEMASGSRGMLAFIDPAVAEEFARYLVGEGGAGGETVGSGGGRGLGRAGGGRSRGEAAGKTGNRA